MRKIIIATVLVILIGGLLVLRNNISPKDYRKEIERCSRAGNKQTCWRDLVMGVFAKDGLDKAYDVVASLYDSTPEFTSSCHDFGHLLGKATYELFAKGKDFKVTPKTSYCSYGFYHGFMEALVSAKGDPKEAREFCQYVDKQLAKETPDVTLQCFHGIGHGWANVHSNPELWGKEEEIAKRGVELCKKVTVVDSELSRCATGVYNGIATFYGSGEYGLKLNKADPLWLCRKQEEKFKDPCYLSMNIALVAAGDGDLIKAAKFVEAIPEDEYAIHAMLNLAIPFGVQNFNSPEHTKAISDCRSLQSRLRIPCIQGYAFAFLESGKPGEEFIKPLEFCGSEPLNIQEKKECRGYIFGYLAQWYPEDKAREICNQEDDKDFCLEAVQKSLSIIKENK